MGQVTGQAGFIVAAYLVTAVVLVAVVLAVILDGRRQRQRLAELESRGIRRRSDRAAGGSAPAPTQPARVSPAGKEKTV